MFVPPDGPDQLFPPVCVAVHLEFQPLRRCSGPIQPTTPLSLSKESGRERPKKADRVAAKVGVREIHTYRNNSAARILAEPSPVCPDLGALACKPLHCIVSYGRFSRKHARMHPIPCAVASQAVARIRRSRARDNFGRSTARFATGGDARCHFGCRCAATGQSAVGGGVVLACPSPLEKMFVWCRGDGEFLRVCFRRQTNGIYITCGSSWWGLFMELKRRRKVVFFL